MKNFLLFISLCLLFLSGVKAMDDIFPEGGSNGCIASLTGDDSSYITGAEAVVLPVSGVSSCYDLDLSDAHSLARQLRTLARNQRSFNSCSSLFAKAFAWKTALLREGLLSHSFLQLYTSLPRFCWKFSSDHYIFAMRRILI